MSYVTAGSRNQDASIWIAALVISLPCNLLILALVLQGMEVLAFEHEPRDPSAADAVSETRSVTIQPVRQEASPAAETEPEARRFARTSEDQAGPAPEDAGFLGERETRAASEAPVVEDAPPLPSQEGIEPRAGEIETTESDYQDGTLAHEQSGLPGDIPAPLAEPEPMAPSAAARPDGSEAEGEDETVSGERTELAEGPMSVDRPVTPDRDEEELKSMAEDEPLPEADAMKEEADAESGEAAERETEQGETAERASAAPGGGGEPGFRGHARKTELKGSISRKGRSALDVESGPLGEYHAAISRAIERAWQREALEHRDLITPGVIRIRVVLDEDGRVRSVGTVEEFGIGAIQKGFTHRAIREADLPDLPDEVRQELSGEPLELLYNFIF